VQLVLPLVLQLALLLLEHLLYEFVLQRQCP
jgi:hypothetical protein